MMNPQNDGSKVYTMLVEINARTGLPTGRVKPNIPSDPNYIPPIVDLIACPLPGDVTVDTIDILVTIINVDSATIKLLYGTASEFQDEAGTWEVPDRIYDNILVGVTTESSQKFKIEVYYDTNKTKVVDSQGSSSVLVNGPFDKITAIRIVSKGDFNQDYNKDYY